MKKLKWAGNGQTTVNSRDSELGPELAMSPATGTAPPGQLPNFCPACPQPDINLPLDWKNNPNRCVS